MFYESKNGYQFIGWSIPRRSCLSVIANRLEGMYQVALEWGNLHIASIDRVSPLLRFGLTIAGAARIVRISPNGLRAEYFKQSRVIDSSMDVSPGRWK